MTEPVISAILPPADGHESGCDLAYTTLSGKQVELGSGISCVLYLEAYAEAVQVGADCGGNGSNVGAGADDEQIYGGEGELSVPEIRH